MPSGLIADLGQIRAVQAAGTTFEVEVPNEAALWGVIDALQKGGVDMDLRRQNPDSPASPG